MDRLQQNATIAKSAGRERKAFSRICQGLGTKVKVKITAASTRTKAKKWTKAQSGEV